MGYMGEFILFPMSDRDAEVPQACFTLYERWVETFVWLFVPFYSEFKSLFILFFLLTRAKVSGSFVCTILASL